MGVLGIISLVSVLVNLIGVAAGVGTSVVQSKQNKELTEKTNETNLQIAQEANAAQAAENEKAYERSKAGNQVGLLMQAGMSRAGAINSLNNGGSYTPAPINTAQMQAPQNDYSGVQQALSGLNGIMSNTGQFASMQKQIAMQEQKNKADIEYVNAQTAATESQTAQTNYSFAMQQLTDDMRKQAASISQRVSASDYDTPESYISALKSKCSSTEQKLFDSPQFVQALNATHQLNQTATSTAAGIRNTNASTANTDKDTEYKDEQIKFSKVQRNRLQDEYDEWKSSPNKSARNMEAEIRQLQATYNVTLTQRELDAYMASLGIYDYYDADGNHHHVYDTSYGFKDSSRAFFKQLHSVIPDTRDLATIVSLLFKK